MSTKSRKKHKSADYKDTKPNNEETEVFVLPPNLLEKLGIKLDNIVSAENFSADVNNTPDLADKTLPKNQTNVEEYFKTPKVVNKKNESSMLETASLMKESVFLSPTFVPTVANVIPGEVEFIQSFEHTQTNEANVQKPIENSYESHAEISFKQNECINTNRIQNIFSKPKETKDFNKGEHNILTVNNCNASNNINTIAGHSSALENKNENQSLTIMIDPTNSHSNEEIYENLKNLEANPNRSILNKKKITVINEEVVKVSNLYKRTSLNPNLNNNVLTPVSMDTLLPTVNSTFVANKVEKNNGTDKVVSLLHDIGRTETDIRQSCDLVVNDVVKHVNVLYVNNDTDMLNDSINKPSLINIFPNIDSNNDECIDFTKLKEHSFKLQKSLQNSVDDNTLIRDIITTQDKLEEEVYIHDTNAEMHMDSIKNTNMSIDNCKIVETNIISIIPDNVSRKTVDDISNEIVDQYELENLDKMELFTKERPNDELINSCSTREMTNESTDLRPLSEIACEQEKDVEVNRCFRNEESCVDNDNFYLNAQKKPKMSLTQILTYQNKPKETQYSKAGLTKSKLCIQGVEKPGGDTECFPGIYKYGTTNNDQEETINEPYSRKPGGESEGCLNTNKIIKTYKKKNKNIKINTQTFEFSDTVKFANNLIDTNKHENDTIALDIVCKTVDFCLCGDFGQLKYYDYDSSYEHIHFWKHNNATSNRDLIFSIYDDDNYFVNDKANLQSETVHNNSEDILSVKADSEECFNNICWNEINGEINYKPYSHGNSKEHDAIENMIKEPSQQNISHIVSSENDDIDLACEILKEHSSKNAEHNQLEFFDTTGDNTEKISGVTEKSDIVYNCFQFTKTNKRLTEKEKVNKPESPDEQTQSTNMLCKNKETIKSPKVTKNAKLNEPESADKQTQNTDMVCKNKKRKAAFSKDNNESQCKKEIKCGVCNQLLARREWEEHSSQQHGLIAWEAGQTFDFGNKTLLPKIKQKLKEDGVLICTFCNIEMKTSKRYLSHVQECSKEKYVPRSVRKADRRRSSIKESVGKSGSFDLVNCGVCQKDVQGNDWIVHICQKHNYLAWKTGEPPLNVDDVDIVEKHLRNVIKVHGPIICTQCGFDRRYGKKGIKTYLEHIKVCDKRVEIIIKKEEPEVEEQTEQMEQDIPINEGNAVKCGVCGQDVTEATWLYHIMKKHNYLAWIEGEQSLDLSDDEQVKQHLYNINKTYDGLICSKCGIKRKYVKKFLSHIKDCDGSGSINDSVLASSMSESWMSNVYNTSQIDDTNSTESEEVKCGVCYLIIKSSDWFDHIGKEHNHMAWKDGEKPLELGKKGIKEHLNGIMKERGYIFCPKCGLVHKVEETSVKDYLAHVASCQKDVIENEVAPIVKEKKIVKCGVCETEMYKELWIKHIEATHNYIAWKEGDTPLDLDDPECIRLHLFTLVNRVGAFKCAKCGVQKKYPKSFLTHLDNCVIGNHTLNESGTSVCAVCSETVETKDWKEHAMEQHYNIAWRVGDDPIDLKSTYGTEKYLKLYKQHKGKLICKTCGISRVSIVGFYAHIIACGKTEEELEEYKNLCEVCNNKYLCIYKNQHMAFHREQEIAKERKLLKSTEVPKEPLPEMPPGGRRRAALRANDVIEQLNSSNEFKHTCPTCGFDTDCDKKLARHKCIQTAFEQNSGSESNESEETEDSKDFDISAEEEIQDTSKKKKNKESIVQAKIPDVPFKYKDVNSYTAQSNEDFYNIHYTDEILFPQWSVGEFEVLAEEQRKEYVPPMDKSCQLKSQIHKEWTTFERFESKESIKGHTIFVGASVQNLSWVPPRMDEEGRNYLAVSCHRGSDSPRFNYDEIATHAGLIQIWDFGKFQKEVPIFAMGLAHDYGTIWAMDWCPSGTRDDVTHKEKKHIRLGLLAIACSNGFVYILSVPHPDTLAERGVYLKLKPVAELRLSMKPDRRIHQATAISWSKQKGHDFVAVGYADGTTALYGLNNASPLLQCTENGVSIFYPYHDEREHNISVTDLDTLAVGCGAASSASVGGAAAAARPGAALARLATHSCVTGCRFAPGWPSVMLAVEESIASQGANELEWYGCGRRLGPMRASCGCTRCGRVLLYAPPVLRMIHALPPYADLRKQNIVGIRAQSLTKESKRSNDELAMKVEPLTYDEVVAQYGIEIFFVDANDKNNSINTMKEQWTERFPLPDVTTMAFCPSETHHHKVAVGIHAGFILLFTL